MQQNTFSFHGIYPLFYPVFLRMSSRMTLLTLTFSLIKKEGSILIKAEISQGGI